MASGVLGRLAEAGLELPPAFAPVATYVGWVIEGHRLWISGQGPTWGTEIRYRGRVGVELDLDQGVAAAELTALNVLAQASEGLAGELDRLTRCVRLFGLVNAADDFADAHKVIDGGSAVMARALGPAGMHARAAVAARALPFGIAVEIEAMFEFA